MSFAAGPGGRGGTEWFGETAPCWQNENPLPRPGASGGVFFFRGSPPCYGWAGGPRFPMVRSPTGLLAKLPGPARFSLGLEGSWDAERRGGGHRGRRPDNDSPARALALGSLTGPILRRVFQRWQGPSATPPRRAQFAAPGGPRNLRGWEPGGLFTVLCA